MAWVNLSILSKDIVNQYYQEENLFLLNKLTGKIAYSPLLQIVHTKFNNQRSQLILIKASKLDGHEN